MRIERAVVSGGAALLTLIASLSLLAGETLTFKSINKAGKVIDAALEAHGGADRLAELKTLTNESEFHNYLSQQSRKPEPPWDKGTQTNFNAIDVEKKIFVTRNAGIGGGFDFDGGNIVNGENSWQLDYRAGTAAPVTEPDYGNISGPFIRVTPALLMKQLQARRHTSHWLGEAEYNGRPHDVITLVMEVGPALALYIDQQTHMLTRMERLLPGFGEVAYQFEDYETIDGIPFNRSFKLLLNGEPNIDSRNKSFAVNKPIDDFLEVAANLERIPEVTPDDFNLQELDEGVFLVGGNGAYGLVIEMADHLVAIGGTQGAKQRIDEARKHVAADKPVRYGVLTHHHSDHVPAAAEYAKEGITVVALKAHEPAVRPAASESAKFEWVEDRLTLSDGSRKIELYDIGPTAHSEHFLVAYLPAERLLLEADHFPQPQTGPLPPAADATRDFAKALERLGLDIERIVGEHSRRVSGTDDLKAVLTKRPLTAVAAR